MEACLRSESLISRSNSSDFPGYMRAVKMLINKCIAFEMETF